MPGHLKGTNYVKLHADHNTHKKNDVITASAGYLELVVDILGGSPING